MASFMGKDGFVWWQGVVEDRHDPLYLGRCKVRILGWHTDVRKDMPISSLPWAYPIQPITSAAQTGVGISPTGPVEGTWVVGFFRDGEAAQEPVFFGTLGGIPEAPTRSDQGFGDPRVVEPPDEGHPFKALAKRLLKYDVNNPNARVPRAPDVITHYGQGDTLPDKDGGQYRWMTDGVSLSSDASGKTQKSVNVLLEEQGTRSNYPDLQNFEGEPTTPRAALGQFGNIEGKGYYSERGILGQKVQWRSALSAGGFSTAQGTDTWNEPDPSVIYGAIYPYNHVHQSESGHIIEVDDTPGKERLHRYHRAGTFEEIGALGQRIMKVANENFNITLSNDYTAVKGNKYENIAGKLDVVTKGGWFQESKSVNVSTSGDIAFSAPTSKFSVKGNDIVLDAAEGNITLKGKSVTIEKRDASNTEKTSGNEVKKVGGKYVLRSGSLQFGSRGGVGITSGLGINIAAGVGGVKESIVGIPGTSTKVTDVAMGDIKFTSHIGDFSAGAGPFQVSGSIDVGLLGTTTITGGFGLSSITIGPLGIELSYLNNSIKLGPAGVDINGSLINIEAIGIATLKSSAIAKVEGSLVMLN